MNNSNGVPRWKLARCSLTALACLVALPLLAQQDRPRPAQGSGASPETVGTPKEKDPPARLGALLETLPWNAETRGPLILVAPEKVRATVAVSELPRPTAPNYGLSVLAPLFGRTLVRVGEVTTLAPPSPPDPMARMARLMELERQMGQEMGGAMGVGQTLPFLASLKEAQWSKLVSPGGIGPGDLSEPGLRAMFEKALPPMAQFETPGRAPDPQNEPSPEEEKLPPLLPAEQKSRLKLRVRRTVKLTIHGGEGNSSQADFDEDEPERAMTTFLLRPMPSLARQRELLTPPTPGPSRAKPTDLEPRHERLDAFVSLRGAKTVGELTARIAKASELNLIADVRLASLSLHIRGERARAGDALGALCRALDGAVRLVRAGSDGCYILCRDRVASGIRDIQMFDSMSLFGSIANAQEGVKAQAAAQEALARNKPLPQTPVALPGFLSGHQKTLDEGKKVDLPLASAPSEIVARARQRWQKHRESILELLVDGVAEPTLTRPKLPEQPDRISATTVLHVELLDPVTGAFARLEEISADDLVPDEAPPLPPFALPNALKTRALLTPLPTGDGERARLIAVATKRGFTHLMVPLMRAQEEPALKALAAAAKVAKIGVVPLLAPLSGAEDPQAERDISVTGRTVAELDAGRSMGGLLQVMPTLIPFFATTRERDYLIPEAVNVRRLAASAARLAALPGVVAVGFSDMEAPGYDGKSASDGSEIFWTGGYSHVQRLAFLRREGADPADLSSSFGMMGMLFLGGFELNEEEGVEAPRPDAPPAPPKPNSVRGLQERWNAWRSRRRDALHQRLAAALLAENPNLTLWKQSGSFLSFGQNNDWEPWKIAPPARPASARSAPRPAPPPIGKLRTLSLLEYQMDGESFRFLRPPIEKDPARRAIAWLTGQLSEPNPGGQSGLVLDGTGLTLEQILAFVEGAVAPIGAKK